MVRDDPERVVPIDLLPHHLGLLKGIFVSCLEGLERDLQFGHGLLNPDQARRECSALKRLLSSLQRGVVFGPDEAAYEVLKRLAAAADDANRYTAVVTEHDALHGFLASLEATFQERIKRSASHDGRRAILLAQDRLPSRGLIAERHCTALAREDEEALDLQLGVLSVILSEHPEQLTYREIAERLFDNLDEPNAGAPLAYAIRDLSLGALVKPRGPLVLPTTAALHIKRLELCK